MVSILSESWAQFLLWSEGVMQMCLPLEDWIYYLTMYHLILLHRIKDPFSYYIEPKVSPEKTVAKKSKGYENKRVWDVKAKQAMLILCAFVL